jgi:hypothetical protein
MTVIAWDGKTLAADRQRDAGGVTVPATKVYECETPQRGRIIFGCAGDAMDIARYVRWAKGRDGAPPTLSDLTIMSIDKDRRIWVADHRLYWCEVNMPYWAIGCGRLYALTALHLGHDAKKAVEVACELDSGCGMGVDVLHHDRTEMKGGTIWHIPDATGHIFNPAGLKVKP